MNLNERISLFSSLAEVLSGKINSTHEKVLDEAILLNPWFTKENINDSLNSIVCMLDEDALHCWIKGYDLKDHESLHNLRAHILSEQALWQQDHQNKILSMLFLMNQPL